MAPPSRRDDLVEAALALFMRDGFHATGIAAILAKAGVNKMTLYNHFASKDELVHAVLELRDARFRHWLFPRMAQLAPGDPRQQLLAMFDALGEWFRGESSLDPSFLGCAFIKAAGEYGVAESLTHRLAAAHKAKVLSAIEDLCRQAAIAEPERAARQLVLLKEGAIIEAFVRGDKDSWQVARTMAEVLLAV